MSQTLTNPTIHQGRAETAYGSTVLLNEQHWSYLQKRYQMTPRELQIAQHVCRGLSNEQIAESLDIKHSTVKTHIRNLYRKIWVRNKISMFLRFVEDVNEFFEQNTVDESMSLDSNVVLQDR